MPEYYKKNYDYKNKSKAELRKILFDHNITPPPFGVLKTDLVKFYEENFIMNIDLFKEKFEKAKKAVSENSFSNIEDFSDDDIQINFNKEKQDISKTLLSINKDKKDFRNESINPNSEEIEELMAELDDLQIHHDNVVHNRSSSYIPDEIELATTPEQFKARIDNFSKNKNFKKTEHFESDSSAILVEKESKKTSFNFKRIFSFFIFLSFLVFSSLEIFSFKKSFFSVQFFKDLVNVRNFNDLKEYLNEFSFKKEVPFYLYKNSETNKFEFKPGFERNKNPLTFLFRKFNTTDKTTHKALEIINKYIYQSQSSKFLTKKINLKKFNHYVSREFDNFYQKNRSSFLKLFKHKEIVEKYEEFGEFIEYEFKLAAKSTFYHETFSLLMNIGGSEFDVKTDEVIITNSVFQIIFENFLEILLFWIFLKLFFKVYNSLKEKREINRIVNEIISQESANMCSYELRECYNEVGDEMWKKIEQKIKK